MYSSTSVSTYSPYLFPSPNLVISSLIVFRSSLLLSWHIESSFSQMYCCVWLRWLHWKQKHFLDDVKSRKDEEETPIVTGVVRKVRHPHGETQRKFRNPIEPGWGTTEEGSLSHNVCMGTRKSPYLLGHPSHTSWHNGMDISFVASLTPCMQRLCMEGVQTS